MSLVYVLQRAALVCALVLPAVALLALLAVAILEERRRALWFIPFFACAALLFLAAYAFEQKALAMLSVGTEEQLALRAAKAGKMLRLEFWLNAVGWLCTSIGALGLLAHLRGRRRPPAPSGAGSQG